MDLTVTNLVNRGCTSSACEIDAFVFASEEIVPFEVCAVVVVAAEFGCFGFDPADDDPLTKGQYVV